jgi:2-oxoglutarate dehydrogenase E2 component (dihydrolipoamide succinyltransferase)
MARYQLLLPKMGESVAEATIIKWVKNPGDYIEADDAVIDIATDKVDSEVPSPVSGTLIEQLCKADDIVQVGAVVAIIETDDVQEEESAPVPAAIASPSKPVVEQTTEPKSQTEVSAPVNVEQKQDPIPGTDLLKKAQVAAPQRAASEPQRFYSPLVKHIAFQEKVGVEELDSIPGSGSDGRLTKDDLLNYLRIRDREKAVADAPPEAPAGYEIGVEVTPVIEMPAKPVEPEIQPEPEVKAEAEPVVAEANPGVAEQPEAKPAAQAQAAPQPPISRPSVGHTPTVSVSGADEIIEMDRMRRLIAEHMVMSKHTSPHVTSFVEADVTGLVMWRDKIKNNFEKREGEKITFTPIFIEAVVKAIKDFPLINSSVNGTQIIRKAAINISMATALPNGNLIVPVIKNADQFNLIGLTKSVNGLATKARLNKLLPDDVKDGTFTITNVGTFGNLMGTPIINQPQVAILAIGAIKKKPAVIETPEGDVIGIRHMMFLSLSYDHRVVDGALGGSFVKRVADYLENWDPNRDI